MVVLIDRSKREFSAVVAAFGFALPAFAQVSNPDGGADTELHVVYAPCGDLHVGGGSSFERADFLSSEWIARS